MYSQPNKNVTYINDLPDLEELESRGSGGEMSNMNFQDNIPDKYKKYIRNSMGQPHIDSGMRPGMSQQQYQEQYQGQEHQHQQQQYQQQQYQQEQYQGQEYPESKWRRW